MTATLSPPNPTIDKIRRILTPASFARAASGGRWKQAPHLTLIDRLVTDAITKGGGRILITLPPRHGKSQMISQYLPAWFVGTYPRKNLILASYEADFAATWGAKARNLLEEYGEWFNVEVNSSSRAIQRWNTSLGGGMFTTGVGGPMTGKGADCLAAGTMIATIHGDVDIQALVKGRQRPLVWAYDHHAGRAVLRRVLATREVNADVLYEVRTAGGRVIRATGDHRFFICGRGYTAAKDLRAGDRLIAQPQKQNMQQVRQAKNRPRQDVPRLLPVGSQHRRAAHVRLLRGEIHATGLRPAEDAETRAQRRVLLQGVQSVASRRQESASLRNVPPACGEETLSILQQGVPAEAVNVDAAVRLVQGDVSAEVMADSILHTKVCERSARRSDEGIGEFAFQDGHELLEALPRNAADHQVPRRLPLYCVRRGGASAHVATQGETEVEVEFGHSPRERSTKRQPAGESRHTLRHVSCSSSQVDGDTVSVVRRLRTRGEPVYDIQVEGCRNFFANGVLVHNCLIIDDPVKNREQADSVTYREKTWDWWTSTAYTRLEPGATVIGLQTRWHEDDWAGRVIRDMRDGGEQWTVVNIPAIAEDDDPLGRQPGESLWPARFDEAALNRIRRAIGPYDWASLYQQRPAPREGGMFHRDWFKIIHGDALPKKFDRLVRYYDRAATQDGGDYSVGILMGVAGGKYYILDMVRGQWSAGVREKRVMETAAIDRKYFRDRVKHYLEQEPGSGGKQAAEVDAARLSRAGYRVGLDRVDSKKEFRAEPFAAAAERGDVYVLADTWNGYSVALRDFFDELTVFPNGIHDDIVDAASGAYNKLVNRKRMLTGL